MDNTKLFEANQYVHVRGFLDIGNCKQLSSILKRETEQSGNYDSQCSKSKSIKNNMTFDKLLVDLLPYFEKEIGLKLLPTYSYARLYQPGEVLKIHSDRPACEISATLTLDFDGDPWPIFMGKQSDVPTNTYRLDSENNLIYVKNDSKISMDIGDVVIYKGCDVLHWRDEYREGKWQAQVFLHYVDANGPNKEWIYDKKGKLNLPSSIINISENQDTSSSTSSVSNKDLTLSLFENAISSAECDAIISRFKDYQGHQAAIFDQFNNQIIEKNVRNVNLYPLPENVGLAALMSGIGFNENSKKWNFDITHANQAEVLRYPSDGGRYTSHIDTILTKDEHINETRKLTVLAFLNDNYTGGKFYIQTSSAKLYPSVKKGSVLIFPSFLVHGVEDVQEGERFSAVTWLVGPWFK